MKYEMFGDIIMTIYKNLKTRMERDLKQFDIGMGQMQILMCFFSDVSALKKQNELVKDLGVDKGNISRSMIKLLEKGYLEQPDENLKCFRLTKRGIQLKSEVMPVFLKIHEAMTENLLEGELDQTIKTLVKISNNLEESL